MIPGPERCRSWPNGLVSKTSVASGHRGFESHPLRHPWVSRGSFISVSGEVSEWPKEHAWKACVSQGTVGSNPTLSAIEIVGGVGGPARYGEHGANRVRPGTEQP